MKKNLLELFEEFISECRYSSKLSDETIRGYRASVDLLFKLMPDISLDNLEPKTLTEFFRQVETRTRIVGRGIEKKGVKKTTIATYRSKLNKFFMWLQVKGHIKDNPFDQMDYPDVRYEDRKYLKKEDVERIFSTANDPFVWRNYFVQERNFAIFSVLLYCGLRRSELLGLKMYDFDQKRKTLTVRAETSKSRRERKLPLNQKVFLALRQYLNQRRECKNEYLFVSNDMEGPLTIHGLKHLVAKLTELSGVKFYVHQFRHTFAINLLNNGTDIAKLKELMGHRDIRMTASYLRCLPTKAMRGDVEALSLDRLV